VGHKVVDQVHAKSHAILDVRCEEWIKHARLYLWCHAIAVI
jgi:hypothetical protein